MSSYSPAAICNLTPRERQVLAIIASGKSTKETAYALGITFKTAVCHRQRIMAKLDVHNMVQLTLAAVRLGVVEVQP